ncbi:hypothetical protein ABDF71_25390 [Ochrobactrum sp. WV_118_8]
MDSKNTYNETKQIRFGKISLNIDAEVWRAAKAANEAILRKAVGSVSGTNELSKKFDLIREVLYKAEFDQLVAQGKIDPDDYDMLSKDWIAPQDETFRPLDISFEGGMVGIAISPEDEQVDEDS